MVKVPYVPDKPDPRVPAVPLPSDPPVLIAETTNDALSSASLSEWEPELVLITSPECSPVAS